jgi:tetratricopeptide (TPR) repeat protein
VTKSELLNGPKAAQTMPLAMIPEPEHKSILPPVKVLSGWRRFLPIYRLNTPNGLKLVLFPRLIVIWSVSLVAIGYFLAGAALFLNDRYRHDLVGVSLVDRLYPPHWNDYATARGDAFIEQAKISLQSNDFARAFHQVRTGLARSPSNLSGRVMLSEMLIAAGRADLAESTLVGGLKFHAADEAYLSRTISFLLSRQRDRILVESMSECIDRLDPASRSSQLAATALATAYLYRGNFDQAEDTLTLHRLDGSRDGRFLSALIEWERGFKELALTLIDQLAREFPDDPNLYRFQVQWQLALNQTDTARRTSLMRKLRFPDQIQPRIDLLYAFDRNHEDGPISTEVAAILRTFGTEQNALLFLGDFAANTGRPEIAKQVLSASIENQIPSEGPSLMVVEANIVAGRYREAITIAHDILEQNPTWETSLAPVFNGLLSIAHFALGDREDANLYLNSFLNLTSVRAENLVAVANRLRTVGAINEARTVLTQAVQNDTLNQPALTQLVEFDLSDDDADELPRNLEKLLTMRRPSPDLLTRAYSRLGSDRFLFVSGRQDLLDEVLATLSGKSAITNVGPNT